ncbi:MAG: nucleotide-binding protein [Flavobacteriales bacterium]
MREEIDPKLRPFLAQLKRLDIGRFTAHPEFRALLFENGWDGWWDSLVMSISLPLISSSRSQIERRESALWSMFQKFYAQAPGAVGSIGVPILAGIMKWKPNDEALRAAINELKKLTLDHRRVLQLEEQLNALLEEGNGKQSTTALSRPASSVGPLNKVFIVHGRAEADRLHLVDLLKEQLGLDPVVMQDSPNDTLETIIAKFERLADGCEAAIILMTPDDETADGKRARQNVVLELGYFLGRWRKRSVRRIIIIRKGKLDEPTDISGVLYLPYHAHPKELLLDLKQQFKHWGFKLKAGA